ALVHVRHWRVDDQPAVDVAHPDRADGALERDVRDRQRRRGAVDREDGRIVLLVDAEHRRDYLDFIPEAVRKKRPDGPVDQPAGEDRDLTRPAFAADEAARDLAGGIEPLLVIAGQREEVDSLPWVGHHGRGQNDRIPLPIKDPAFACPAELAVLRPQPRATDSFGLVAYRHSK